MLNTLIKGMNSNNLLNKFRCKKTDDYTHLCMYPYGGVFKIPQSELKQFYEDYQLAINNGLQIGLLEKPMDNGPVLVDVDIKVPATSKHKKVLYDDFQIKQIISKYNQVMMEMVQYICLEDLLCVVLTKPGYVKDGYYKNGFHLHFPHVWLSLSDRKTIMKKVKEELDPSLSVLIDPCSVKSNWFLYGALKCPEAGTYKVETTFTYIWEEVDFNSNVENLSIRDSPLKNCYNLNPKYVEEVKVKPVVKHTMKDNNLVTRCLENLNDSRADDYPDWIKVGCILKQSNPEDGLELWKEFSQRSHKYDESYIEKVWDNFRDYNYTLGSLVFMAREDNPNFTIDDPIEKPTQRLLSNVKPKRIIKVDVQIH